MIVDMTDLEGYQLSEIVNEIKGRLWKSEITYDEAKQEAQPVIDEINRRGKEISKKYNKRFACASFSKLMR